MVLCFTVPRPRAGDRESVNPTGIPKVEQAFGIFLLLSVPLRNCLNAVAKRIRKIKPFFIFSRSRDLAEYAVVI